MNRIDQSVKFQSLEESLVLKFEYDCKGKQIEFVYDYAAEVVSKHFHAKIECQESKSPLRDFRRITFYSVDNFQIQHHKAKGDQLFALLREKITSPGVVVVNSQFTSDNQYKSAKLDFSFGFQVLWNYQSTSIEQKLCHSRQISENKWKYYDNTTLKEVNFYKPFD